MNSYGVKIWLALAVTFVPAIQAYLNCGTLEVYPYYLCLAIGAAISVLIAYIVRRRSKNRLKSGSANNDATFEKNQAVTCLRYLGPPLWVLAAGLFFNRVLDTSEALTHEVRFLGFTTYKRGPSTVEVESWRYPHTSEFMRYDWMRMTGIGTSTPRGKKVLVSIREGALGWNWVESIQTIR